MSERFLNLRKDIDIQIQGAQRTPRNSRGPTMRHIIKLLKDRQRKNLENRKCKVTHHKQEIPNKTLSRFLSRNLEGQKVMGKNI